MVRTRVTRAPRDFTHDRVQVNFDPRRIKLAEDANKAIVSAQNTIRYAAADAVRRLLRDAEVLKTNEVAAAGVESFNEFHGNCFCFLLNFERFEEFRERPVGVALSALQRSGNLFPPWPEIIALF